MLLVTDVGDTLCCRIHNSHTNFEDTHIHRYGKHNHILTATYSIRDTVTWT